MGVGENGVLTESKPLKAAASIAVLPLSDCETKNGKNE